MTQQQGALYLRVRPQDFDGIVGNEAAVQVLQQALGNPEATRPHVFALTGISGGGKTTLARICAKVLGAEEVHERNCSKDTGKDAMDDLTESFQYLPTSGTCNVYILDESHFLSKQAWSTLLKPMEDCPGHIYLFILTSEGHKIPAANMNRCLQVEVSPLSTSDAKRLIKQTTKSEGIELPKEAVTPIIEASEGSSRQILQNVEKVAGALESGAELHEALKLLSGPQEDDPGVKELYKALCAGGRSLRDTLKTLKTMDPETLRRGVLGYASAIYLNTGDGAPLRIMQAMSSGNTFDCGFPGLVALCSLVSEG